MSIALTAQEKELVELLKAEGVLKALTDDNGDVLGRHAHKPRKAIYVGCPDCDQLKSIMVFHGTTLRQKLHPVAAIHGGGSAFHRRSPFNTAPVEFPELWYLYQIASAFDVKRTRNVAFYAHTKCGAAARLGISIPQTIELLLYNRGFVETNLGRISCHHPVVEAYFHVDFGDKRKRTYEVDINEWVRIRDRFADELTKLSAMLPLSLKTT
jgi:hypothetical protein